MGGLTSSGGVSMASGSEEGTCRMAGWGGLPGAVAAEAAASAAGASGAFRGAGMGQGLQFLYSPESSSEQLGQCAWEAM